MEIAPVPHRATRSERRRLALGLLILVPVVLLLLLPAALGLDRYVVTEAVPGGAPRGSVVLARAVPPTDLEVGDVITFRPPGAAPDDQTTRRIGAPAEAAALEGDSYERVVLTVPWVGHPFLVGGWFVPAAGALLAALAALLLLGGSPRRLLARRVRTPAVTPPIAAEAPARLPVG